MREQIRRILELVQAGKLAPEDAAALLEALSARLSLSEQAKAHVFGLLSAPDFGAERVLDLLLGRLRAGEGGVSGAPAWADWMGERLGSEVGRELEGLGSQISARVQEALARRGLGVAGLNVAGLGGAGPGGAPVPPVPPARPGTTLRVETEDEDGGTFSANLPLSLAGHAARLLPPRALKALERAGVNAEALALLLQAGPPPGDLLTAEDDDGNRVRLTVTDGVSVTPRTR